MIPVESWIVHFGWFGSEHVCGGFAEASDVTASTAKHVSRAAAAANRVLIVRPFLGSVSETGRRRLDTDVLPTGPLGGEASWRECYLRAPSEWVTMYRSMRRMLARSTCVAFVQS